MTNSIFDTKREETVLEFIHDGMKVLDANNTELGTVDRVYLGEVGSEATGRVAATSTVTPTNDPGEGLAAFVQGLFGKEELPVELQERLLQNGFIHIDVPGILSHDRFVIPAQIARVTNEGVVLRATRSELIKETP